MTYEEASRLLAVKGQEHVLAGFDALSGQEQETLLTQIAQVDWDVVSMAGREEKQELGQISQLPAVDIDEIEIRKSEFTEAGLAAIRQGKVGAVLLAGGMGTRLGLDKPKGELDVGINRPLYLFQRLIMNLQEVTEMAGTSLPLYVMTSEKNDAETRRFFAENRYFGYPEEDVRFYVQEMAAAVDYQGKLLKEAPGRLATSPNGNGGWFSSLAKAGLTEDLHRRGVEWLNVFAVDNVLQRIADPAFIGATILSGKNSGSKVVRKVDPYEKMGVICAEDGVPAVVEYYELTPEMAEARDEKGNLKYAFGVILNYLFSVSKLEEVMAKSMPVHVVEKKIPYIDAEGNYHKPDKPNGYKFETLAVDLVAMMENTLPYEVIRDREFAPIKNLHGVDSLDSARELLEKNGVEL
ncbi:UTP--glucose-1-phosphate uridylyltransferase [Shuttleworthella sp. MSX8B]|uniref:UTP--glucose-1-phosphate uridylyltransferase n=1 Tax=Shuttleworthella sp. MSX8B TaxID=936574 RepID=UPI000452D5B4|nr:UTP--glucose-1-phosphate uridylyltransferase [Shuttleworthia sp. MSX8B]EUB12937.1 UTP--glucose-1-phosphate uridylyltransferase [Shuttleworthia sp. MSX8B]